MKEMLEKPRPKSPPGFLYHKRRQQANLHLLDREIALLQEELKSLDGIQPSSRCCKELNDFLATKQDPFLAINQKPEESNCCWRTNRKKCSLKSSWICCFSGCCKSRQAHNNQQQAKKTGCCSSSCSSCCCNGCSGENCCRLKCCSCRGCSCFSTNCCSFKLSCSSSCCSKVKLCPSCVSGSCGCSCCC